MNEITIFKKFLDKRIKYALNIINILYILILLKKYVSTIYLQIVSVLYFLH